MSNPSLTLVMGLTLKVFDTTLPNAALPYLIQKQDNGYQLTYKTLSITITLSEQKPRVIAGLTLPVTLVELHFINHSTTDIENFMLRFKRYFHRGGG